MTHSWGDHHDPGWQATQQRPPGGGLHVIGDVAVAGAFGCLAGLVLAVAAALLPGLTVWLLGWVAASVWWYRRHLRRRPPDGAE
jgi:hypothetical protein